MLIGLFPFGQKSGIAVWEKTARQLAKGEWKFRVASKIHFILAGLASNSCKDGCHMWSRRCLHFQSTWVCNKSNTMGATCGAEDAYTSRAPGFVTRVTRWVPHVEQKMLTLQPRCSGSVSIFCSTCGTHRVTLDTNPGALEV
jgi:hypothetical protein